MGPGSRSAKVEEKKSYQSKLRDGNGRNQTFGKESDGGKIEYKRSGYNLDNYILNSIHLREGPRYINT